MVPQRTEVVGSPTTFVSHRIEVVGPVTTLLKGAIDSYDFLTFYSFYPRPTTSVFLDPLSKALYTSIVARIEAYRLKIISKMSFPFFSVLLALQASISLIIDAI